MKDKVTRLCQKLNEYPVSVLRDAFQQPRHNSVVELCAKEFQIGVYSSVLLDANVQSSGYALAFCEESSKVKVIDFGHPGLNDYECLQHSSGSLDYHKGFLFMCYLLEVHSDIRSWKDMLRLTSGIVLKRRPSIIWCALLASTLSGASPLLFAKLFQQGFTQAASAHLLFWSAALSAVLLAQFIASAWRDIHLQMIGLSLESSLTVLWWRQMLEYRSPVVVSNISVESNKLSELLRLSRASNALLQSVLALGLGAAFNIVVLYYLLGVIASIPTAIAIAGCLVVIACGKRQARAAIHFSREASRMYDTGALITEGREVLQSFGALSRGYALIVDSQRKRLQELCNSIRADATTGVTVALLPPLGLGMLLSALIISVHHSGNYIGDLPRLAGSMIAFTQLLTCLATLGAVGSQIVVSSESFESRMQTIEIAAKTAARTDADGIVLEKIRCHPKGRRVPILSYVNARFLDSNIAFIKGASGSGKTTICRIILGLESGYEGVLRVNGVDGRAIDWNRAMVRVGAVLQTSTILPGTIKENIAIAHALSDAQIWAALTIASLKAEAEMMPLGLYTRVGPGGFGLSNGQQQRLLIARAVAYNPELLVLDEAMSCIDEENVAIIINNLREMRCVRIITTHRYIKPHQDEAVFSLVDGILHLC